MLRPSQPHNRATGGLQCREIAPLTEHFPAATGGSVGGNGSSYGKAYLYQSLHSRALRIDPVTKKVYVKIVQAEDVPSNGTSAITSTQTDESNTMNTPSALRFMLGSVALFSLVTGVYAGGGEIVTLKDFPDFAVAGKPLSLTFTVRVPREPLADLQPNIRATFCPSPCSSGLATNANVPVANARAKAGAATGEYNAVLILPEPGDWVITIDTDLAGTPVLPPLNVIFPGTAAPTPFLPATRGLRLFTAKGCYACHFHEEVNGVRAYART